MFLHLSTNYTFASIAKRLAYFVHTFFSSASLFASSQYGADACIKHQASVTAESGLGHEARDTPHISLQLWTSSSNSQSQNFLTQLSQLFQRTLTHIQLSFIDSVHKQIDTQTMYYSTSVANNTLIKTNDQFRISMCQLA